MMEVLESNLFKQTPDEFIIFLETHWRRPPVMNKKITNGNY